MRPRRPAADGAPGPRVLLICGALRPGLDGVADYVVRLAEALRAAGAVVRILHTGPAAGVRGARSAGPRWSGPALLRAARAARSADVVHVQFAPSMYGFRAAVGLLPAIVPGRRLVTTLHEYGWWRWEARLPPAVWRRLELARLADRETGLLVPRSASTVVTNPAHAAVVADRFGGRLPVRAIPIGANVDVLAGPSARDAARSGLGAGPGTALLAFFGFVHPVKGVRYLAEAVAALAAEGRDVRLVVIGGFESLALPGREARDFEAELRGQVAAAGAADRVVFTGFTDPDAVSRLLTGADAAVLPFTAGVTGKSGSLLTVLAHGLPTVVTAGPDPDPELADGDQVVVVPAVRDGAALAAGLRRVLDDPALAARVAARGAAWAAEHDWDRIAAAHLALYEEAR